MPADDEVGPVPEGREPGEYDRLRRRVLWMLPTGLFVVGSRADDRRNLMTCNWVMQIATTPKLVAISVERGSLTGELVEAGGGFSVSLLSKVDRPLVRRFVKPVEDVEMATDGTARAMQGQEVHEVTGGLPVLTAAVSWLSCAVRRIAVWDDEATGGVASHRLFVGEVVDVGESVPGQSGPDASGEGSPDVLRMEDTRMNYGG